MDAQIPLIALIPTYVLAVLMYTLLGRFLLSFLFAPDSKNYIFRAFVWLTNPVLALIRPITPAATPHPVLLVFAAVWMLLARIVVTLTILNAVQAT